MNFREWLAEQLRDERFAEQWRESEPSSRVASLLIGLRVKYGLTQEQLAEKAGVKRSYIARIEAGDANPTVRSLDKILRGLGLSLKLEAETPTTAAEQMRACISNQPPFETAVLDLMRLTTVPVRPSFRRQVSFETAKRVTWPTPSPAPDWTRVTIASEGHSA